ncbi:aerotolerance regulator BatD [Leptospira fletcheri]|uniref:Aerotolerance regulator BatD n=1 Tax=Leptospira fletcheri TaxID=2484981 RepID=A0A4R9GCZ3_9LEPT|nr:BatD family protein [Leptospira fletcheri]TGK09060.1 aerotolerance regulator BatD [Leptospira fletcheri]
MNRKCLPFLLLLFSVPLIAGEPKFYLSQSRAELGDPVFAVFELEGATQVRLLEKEFHGKGIKAVYWGMEDNTTILNYKAYRKKMLKYRLVVSGPGKYEVPEISLELDGKRIRSASLVVEFGAKPPGPRGPGSIWNRFFSNESEEGPADGDLKVVFQLDKKEVWMGQPLLGFYALYYRNSIRPYFDRDPSSSIEFPYFRSEILSGMSLNIPETVLYDGVPYETFPYNKEFFVLTPLKPGEYSLGSTSFHLEGQLQSYFHMRTIRSVPGKIRVKPLLLAPPNFSGAVGRFRIETGGSPADSKLGEPFLLKLNLQGKGNLAPVQDPIRSSCGSPDCFPEITLVQSVPQREFKELDPGEYGFRLNYSYTYSVLPQKQGLWNRGTLSFVYFDPYLGNYSQLSISLPTVKVGPPAPPLSESNAEKRKDAGWKWWFWGFVALAVSCAAYLGLYQWKKIGKRVETLKRLDEWIGSKRGLVLKHSVLAKGLSEGEAALLADCKSKEKALTEMYSKLDPASKIRLLGSAKRILNDPRQNETI